MERSPTRSLREIEALKFISQKRMKEVKDKRHQQSKKLGDLGATASSDFRTFSKSDAVKWLDIEHTNTFDRAFSTIKSKYPTRDFERESNKNYAFTLSDLHLFAEEMGVPAFIRSKTQKCITIAIGALKGGVGKTTTTVNAAAGLALSNKRLRIAVIDMDPQGTATLIGLPNFSDEYYSVGDILTNQYTLDPDETDEGFVRSCFLPTSIPNLKYLPGIVSDAFFENHLEALLVNGDLNCQTDAYRLLKERIIDVVKDDFDIILIDTPPTVGKIAYNTLYAADAFIIPMMPDMFSFDATMKYMERFEEIYKMLLQAGHEGFYFIRFLITNLVLDKNSTKQQVGANYLAMMRRYFHDRVIPTPMYNSKAIGVCTDFFSTVYGLKNSEYSGTKSHLIDAQRNMDDIVRDIETLCFNIWEPNEFEGV
jgi:chromosome partitioning protein